MPVVACRKRFSILVQPGTLNWNSLSWVEVKDFIPQGNTPDPVFSGVGNGQNCTMGLTQPAPWASPPGSASQGGTHSFTGTMLYQGPLIVCSLAFSWNDNAVRTYCGGDTFQIGVQDFGSVGFSVPLPSLCHTSGSWNPTFTIPACVTPKLITVIMGNIVGCANTSAGAIVTWALTLFPPGP